MRSGSCRSSGKRERAASVPRNSRREVPLFMTILCETEEDCRGCYDAPGQTSNRSANFIGRKNSCAYYLSSDVAENFTQGESGLSESARWIASRALAFSPCLAKALASQTQVSSCAASSASDF